MTDQPSDNSVLTTGVIPTHNGSATAINTDNTKTVVKFEMSIEQAQAIYQNIKYGRVTRFSDTEQTLEGDFSIDEITAIAVLLKANLINLG